MAERMTSPEEAAEMKAVIMATVDDLESDGFDRGQIGAAMAGIGLALTSAHHGNNEAMRIWESVKDALMSGASRN